MLKKCTVKDKNRQSGFTLVELAIVFIILGLFIAGVIKGAELIENARATSISAQIKTYQSAITSFRDTYGALPGDMRDATQRINGCDATNNCTNGDGNQMIGIAGRYNQVILNTVTDDETLLFWKHLVLANLISGVSPDARSTFVSCAPNCSPEFGATHPRTPFGGGFYLTSSIGVKNGEPTAPFLSGGIYFLAANMTRFIPGPSSTVSLQPKQLFSPSQAQRVDTKMDDGFPQGTAGRVIATPINRGVLKCANVPGGIPGTTSSPPTSPPALGDYSPSGQNLNAKTCALYFHSGL